LIRNSSTSYVGIITGAGPKAFCVGMDFKGHLPNPHLTSSERSSYITTHTPAETARDLSYPINGFAGLTHRVGEKPIISAVNGPAHSGGFEIALNSDVVLASPTAKFRLPDALRGTAALMGAFPRLCALFGLQRAMLIALTAYTLGAEEAREWGLVQKVVKPEKLVEEAVEMAKCIAGMSPDSVVVSRAGVWQAWETGCLERARQLTADMYGQKLLEGANVREGLKAFLEKREPKWVPSKL
jgi:enoyl-CoA hydratase/carnithine racemase